MKKALSTLLAAASAAFLCISAAAADYGAPPVYELPQPAASANNMIESNDILGAFIFSAPVDISGDSASFLTLGALSEIANLDVPVMFTADGYTVVIDPADITNSARAIDLSMNITVTENISIEGMQIPAVIIAPSSTGNFGFALTVTIPAWQLAAAGLDMNNIKAYHISSGGAVTQHDVTVNPDGSVSVKFSGASEYIITDRELTVTQQEQASSPLVSFGIGGSDDIDTPTSGLTGSTGNPKTGITDNSFLLILIALPVLIISSLALIGIRNAKKKAEAVVKQ